MEDGKIYRNLGELYQYLSSLKNGTDRTLSKVEEDKIAIRAKAGDESAIDDIFSVHRRYLFNVLKKFAYHNLDNQTSLSDLAGEVIQVVLSDSIDKFDPTKNRKFGSYIFGEDYINQIIRRRINADRKKGIKYFPQNSLPYFLPIPNEGNGEDNLESKTLEERVSFITISKIQQEKMSVADVAEKNLDSEYIIKLLKNLPKSQREIIRDYYLNEKSYQQIADEKGCSKQNVGRVLNKGMKALRKKLLIKEDSQNSK